MANIYDKVNKKYVKSVHTPDFIGNPDYLINPDTSQVDGLPVRYWKVEFDQLVPMLQAERDNVDAQILADRSAVFLAQAEHAFNNDPTLMALTKLMFKEINKLRVANGDLAYTVEQFNAALQTELEASV
jgi:hypothetical protein